MPPQAHHRLDHPGRIPATIREHHDHPSHRHRATHPAQPPFPVRPPAAGRGGRDHRPGPPPITEPLSALETHRTNAEAVERATETSKAVSEARRRGRIEAETHRISEEVTHQAQERRRAQQAQQAQARETVPSAASVAPPAIEGTPMRMEAAPPPAPPAPAAVPLRPFPGSFRFTRILVPLDGTFYAERALPYATGLARLTGASLILGHVSLPPLPAPAQVARRLAEEVVGHSQRAHDPGATDRATDMEAYLEAQCVLQAFRAPTVSVETIEDRDPVFGLRQLAEHDQSDVMVLATHARQGIERQVLGSTVDALVEQSHLPLLVIPPHVVVPSEPPSFARMLVPLDGSAVAEYALALLVGLLQAAASTEVIHWEVTNWQITLFTVTESRALKVEARAYLEEVEVRLKATALPEGVRISTRVLLGSAPGAIVAVADHGVRSPDVITGPFDLVVMATHGRGGLGRLLYGSVTRYVLPRVAVPVLVVHPTDVSI